MSSSKKTDDEIKAEHRRRVRANNRARTSDDEDESFMPGAYHSMAKPKASKRSERDSVQQRQKVFFNYILDQGEEDEDEENVDDLFTADENVTSVGSDPSKSQAERANHMKVTGSTLGARQSRRILSHLMDDDDNDSTVMTDSVPLRRAPVTYRDNTDPDANYPPPPPVEEEKLPESQDEGSELSAELIDEEQEEKRLKQTLERVLENQNAVQVVDVEAEDKLKRARQRRNFSLYALLAAVVLGGVVAAVVVTSNRQQTLAPTISPSMSPTMAPTTRQSAVMEAVMNEFGDLPEDENTPQYRAIQWLTELDTTTEFPLDSDEAEYTFLERYVAAVFAYTTQYVYWIDNENWLNADVSVCEWFGLSCNDDGRIGVMDLSVQNLDGPIPSEIGYLDNLDFVFLFRNKLRGPIPPEIGNLGDVDFMYLNENQLTGQIPNELSGLLDADELFLFGNQLTGTIPAEFGGLVDLMNLYMHDNMLSGEIPSSLSRLKRLQRLYLQDNNLQGKIPSYLGGVISLQRIQLQNNKLTGTIPKEFGGFIGLSVLKLEGNNLTGQMPKEICAKRDVGPIDNLEILETDCADPVPMVNCTCCSFCW